MSAPDELIQLFPIFPAGSWTESALCAQVDPDGFFPEDGRTNRRLIKICASCDVQAQCLDYALENREEFGVWAGTTVNDRKRIVRERGEVWRGAYRDNDGSAA